MKPEEKKITEPQKVKQEEKKIKDWLWLSSNVGNSNVKANRRWSDLVRDLPAKAMVAVTTCAVACKELGAAPESKEYPSDAMHDVPST